MSISTNILTDIIREHGPIDTVRVSSAQASGNAKNYSYWGAARYQIRLTRAGQPANFAEEAAGSDRRSYRLAEQDAADLAAREDRILCQTIGTLSDEDCTAILADLADQQVAA